MAELPVLPLKTDALLADTSHMSAEEFGAYVRILLVMWRQGATLPDNDKELARIAGVSPTRWRKIAESVRRPLTGAGGVLSQKRLTDTWIEAKDRRARRAGAADARWGKKVRPAGGGTPAPMQRHKAPPTNAHAMHRPQAPPPAHAMHPLTINQFKNLSSQSPEPRAREAPAELPPLEHDNSAATQERQQKRPPSQATRAEMEANFERRRRGQAVKP